MTHICRGLIFFLIIAVATIIWPNSRTAIDIKDIVVQVTYVVILAFSGLSILFKDRFTVRRDPVMISAAVFGIMMIAAYMTTNQCSLNEKAVMPQLCGVMTFIFVTHWFDKDDIGKLVRFSVAAGVIASVYGILQYFYLDPLNWKHIGAFGTLRVLSFFGNKNYFAMFLLLMIPMGGYVIFTAKTKISFFFGIAAAATMMSALALSNSRGALLGFFLSAVAASLLFFLKNKKISGKKIGFLKKLGFAVPLALILLIVFLAQDIRKDYARRIKYRGHYIMERVSLYLAAAEVIARHPLFGVGPGNFLTAYPRNEKYRVNTANPNYVLTHVHNDFLEIWAEYGLFTFLAFTGFLCFFAQKWARRFKASRETEEQAVLLMIFCALNGYLFYSLLDVGGRYISSVFYFWSVTGIGYIYLEDKADFVSISNILSRNKFMVSGAALIILLIFGLAYKKILANYLSDVYINKAYASSVQGNYDNSFEYLEVAVSANPKSVEAYYQRGFVFFSQNRIDAAINDYKKVNEMSRDYVNVNFNIASCFYKKKDWDAAIREAEISHRLFPDYVPTIMLLAYGCYQAGKFEKASEYCDSVLQRYKGHKPALKLRQQLEVINKKEEKKWQ